jgi:uncharacterized cupredoxin-like copper-binding protein
MRQEDETRSRFASIDPLVFIVVAMTAVFAVIGVLVLATRNAGSSSNRSLSGHHMYAGHVTPNARRGDLEVLVGDYWFKPSTHRLRAGVYRFVAHNYGIVQHDVMLERTPIRFSAPGTPVDEAAPYGVDGLQPGMTKSTTVMLTAGRWEVFCSVAGHYQSGQHQILTVYGRMPRGMRAPRSTGMGMDGGDGGGMNGGGMGSSATGSS